MRTIKWLGGTALAFGAAFLAALAIAAPGDRVVVQNTPEATLTGAQVSGFVGWAIGVFDVPSPSALQIVQCGRKRRRLLICESTELLTGTPAQFTAAEDDADAATGVRITFIQYDDPVVTYERRQKVRLNAAQLTGLGTWVKTVSPSFPIAETEGITLYKDGAAVKVQAKYNAILNSTQYVQALSNGLIHKRTGTVQ